MKINYPSAFHLLIRSLELEFDPFDELNDDQYCDLLEAVSEYLQLHGINLAGDGVNEIGALCEGLLDWLVDQEEGAMRKLEWYGGKPLENARWIDEFEKKIGYEFPACFRQCVLAHNGGSPVPSCFDTAEEPEIEVQDFDSFDPGDKGSVWSFADLFAREYADVPELQNYVIFAGATFGDLICFDRRDDSVVLVYHETGVVARIAPDFETFLNQLYDPDEEPMPPEQKKSLFQRLRERREERIHKMDWGAFFAQQFNGVCRKYGLWTKKWDDRTCALMGQNYILIFTGDLYAGLEVAYLRRDADGDLRLWDLTQYLRMEISDRDRKKTITVKTITDQWKRDTMILSRLLGRRFKNLLSGGSTWMCSFFRSPHMRMGLRRSDELMPKAANYLTHKKTGNPDMRVFWAQVCFKNVCKKYPVKLAKLTDKALLLKGEDYGLAFVVEDNVVCVCYFRREDGMKVWNVTGYLAQAVGESAWNPIAGRHELVNKNVFLLLARVLQEQFADLLAGGCVWMLDYQNSAYYQPPNDTVKHNEVD